MTELTVNETRKIKAFARNLDGGWASLRFTFETNSDIVEILTFTTSLEIAEAYANAINACNDREAVDADESANTNA